MGHGYKGDTGHYHSLSENVSSLKASFPFNEKTGYFGEKGSGRDGKGGTSNKVREIASSNPKETAKKFYDSAAHGGK